MVVDRETGTVRTVCSTEGPAFFRPVYAGDARRIALAEAPFLKEGAVAGKYRVTVFR